MDDSVARAHDTLRKLDTMVSSFLQSNVVVNLAAYKRVKEQRDNVTKAIHVAMKKKGY